MSDAGDRDARARQFENRFWTTTGTLFALVGNTGIATSSHLHYEVRGNGKPQNPMNYVIAGAVP